MFTYPPSTRFGKAVPFPLLVARHHALQFKQREAKQFEAKLAREKQFARKVEINQRLREIISELAHLTEGARTSVRPRSTAPNAD